MPRSPFRAALRAGTVTMVAGGFAVASALTPAGAVTTSAKPVRQVPVTNLQSMTISNNGSLYVVNSSSIDVWSPSSDGIPDVTKTITGANVSGFPSLKEGTGLAYASSGASVVVINPGQAAGAAVPIRTISGAATKIDSPAAVAWTPSGSLWVEDENADSTYELLRFAPGADGNVAPVQQIHGSHTGLNTTGILGGGGAAITGLPGNGVAAAPISVDPQVMVFTGSQTGNAYPHRSLQVPTPTPHWLTDGVASDPQGRIYIGSGDLDGNQFGRLDVFGPTGTKPILTLGGTQQRFQVALSPVVAANGTMALLDATIVNLGGSGLSGAKVDFFKPLFAKPSVVRSLKVSKSKKTQTISWAAPTSRGGTAALSYKVVVKKGSKTKFSKSTKSTSLSVKRKSLPKGKLKVTVTAVNVGGSGPGVTKKLKN